MAKKVVATVENAHECPVFRVGDRMTFSLPELVTEETDAVCAIAVSDLLPWTIKLTAGGGAAGGSPLLCRGCRGGRAQAGFALENLGEVARDPRQTRKLVSLRVIPLFAPLPDRELEKISPMIKEVQYKTGEEILTFGQPGKALSIVSKGQVEVVKPEGGSDKLLAVLSEGECFGEMSLLTGDNCSATIRTRGDVDVLQITKKDFDGLLARNPVLNRYFSKLLALRMNKMSKQFSDETSQAITGSLNMLGPTELVQAITVTARTGALKIARDAERTITIAFHEGQMWSMSSTFHENCEEAFYEFLTWTNGQFRFEPSDGPTGERSFFKDTTSLLLEGMRRLDEIGSQAKA